MTRRHVGSDFDDFLREEELLHAAESMAAKRVIAFRIAEEMKARGLSKSEMARRMGTSRAALERLLDPANPSVTLATLERAATALGATLKVDFVKARR
jgi:DNA-binding Xre family transcriptional regulator